jgi:hypothetical protein
VIERLGHAVIPLAVIVAATVLGVTNVLDPNSVLILIVSAGGYGSVAVAASGKPRPPAPPSG